MKKWPQILMIFLLLGLVVPADGAERRTPVVDAVAKAGPAVVNIRTEQIVKSGGSRFFGFADPFFEEFFRNLMPPRTYKTQSLGSGVIIDPKGFIVTNAHVIEKASKIYVALADGRDETEASLVGKADFIDLAVIKIKDCDQYPFLKPATSNDLLLGETVVAIGNPLGLGHSITTGVISAIQRRVPMEDKLFSVFIQTDALINPGNSGGPLINIDGDFVGINTAIARQAQGIGFAIPIDSVKRVLPDLLERGELRKPYHGIIPAPVGKDFIATNKGGVLVAAVDDKSPAAKSGVRYGDVVVELDSIQVTSPAEMQAMLNTYIPGNRIGFKIWRGFEAIAGEMILTPFPEHYGLEYGKKVFGLVVTDSPQGVFVKKVVDKSAADRTGLQPGDLVYEIGGHQVKTLDEYSKTVEAHIGFEPLRFTIVRDRQGYYVDLP